MADNINTAATTTAGANQNSLTTFITILLQSVHAHNNLIGAIVHHIVSLHSRIGEMVHHIHHNTRRIDSLTLTLFESANRLRKVPQPPNNTTSNSTTTATTIISTTPAAAASVASIDAHGVNTTCQASSEVDGVKKKVEYHAQTIGLLNIWLHGLKVGLALAGRDMGHG
ncbi:hypothetical protein BGZ95_009335 [Linnemannia exigua]|uniref:Uncharacterized protein n=1 Tax=Linnemannia exigua TaxID=604196 RepID=A0AAD4H767_9FUNG|nr:hypothetical protein BGZ95_009335 [Linnemannia exigua]